MNVPFYFLVTGSYAKNSESSALKTQFCGGGGGGNARCYSQTSAGKAIDRCYPELLLLDPLRLRKKSVDPQTLVDINIDVRLIGIQN